MKKFRKNTDGFFLCEECKKIFKNSTGLKSHISRTHNKKEYFDKWIKDDNDGKCKICGNSTIFNYQYFFYKNCCSKKCTNKYNYIQTRKGCLKMYGIENIYQQRDIIEKIKIINSKKSNEEKEKIKNKRTETNKKLYGCNCSFQNKEIQQKFKSNCLKKYGVENPFQSERIKEKIKKTNLRKYGVEFPSQNREIFNKGFKTRIKIHQYKNTDLLYQGSYELDFLNKYIEKINIKNGLSLPYKINNKKHYYHTDFYIPHLNLVVEIKSSRTLKLQTSKEIIQKENAVKKAQYRFLMILNKNYKKFNKVISQ